MAWRTAEYDFSQCGQNILVVALLRRKQIRKGIEGTKFTFRDAKVPRTRPSCRLQALAGETPAAANDSSQQTEEDHFHVTVYYTSIDKVVSELQSRWEGNDQEVFCALKEYILL